MWSRKPTPVARVPAPVPSSASVEAHVGLGGVALDASRVRLMRPWILPDARLHRLGVHLEALGAGDRGAGGGELARRASPIRTSAIVRRKWRGESAEAKRAAPPVGSTWLEPAT